MSKIIGFNPDSSTIQEIKQFENGVMIRRENQVLLGTVYANIQNDQWAVSMARTISLIIQDSTDMRMHSK